MHSFELVWFPGTCGRVTLIALEEIGVEVRERHVLRGWHRDPEYLELNPKGRLPTLIVDGKPYTETPAIIMLLANLYPDSNLLPSGGPELQADAFALMSWFSSGIHPSIGRARFPGGANDQPESWERTRELAIAGLQSSFAIIDRRLGESEWLYDEWSAIDGYLLWLWFRVAGIALDPSEFPKCADHAARCQERPSVSRALDREEAAYADLKAAKKLPDWEPSGQVGRV